MDQLFAAIHTVAAVLSSPLAMLLFATPLECNGCIYYLPARRAETYRSIRAPVVHVGAGDSSPCQLLCLDSGPAREMRRILRMTVELCGFTSRVSVAPGNLQIPPRRRTPRPSGVRLRARLDRPPLWIGTLPRRIRAVRRSRRKSSPDRIEELFRASDPPDVLLHLLVQRARGPSPICRLTVLELRCFPLESLR